MFALQDRLRREGHAADFVAAVLTQQRLRARAVAKFGEFAGDLLYTPDGLEQASRLEVAATHAGRFYNASLATVHDLGCGIGSDAVAMSALGRDRPGRRHRPRDGGDRRHQPAALARLARPRGLRRGVRAAARPAALARRRLARPGAPHPGKTGRHGRIKRVFRLDEIRPSWQFVLQVATAVPATGAKLSPSMPHDAIPLGTEAQWTSYGGEVLECAVWWGPLAQRPAGARASSRRGARRSRSTRRWPSRTRRPPRAPARSAPGSTSRTAPSRRPGCSGP